MTTSEELKAEIERLKTENILLKNFKPDEEYIHMKVSEKGAVSVYGISAFPITLYKNQWNTLIERAPEIRDFINANLASLKFRN